jgi:hypothetical protein
LQKLKKPIHIVFHFWGGASRKCRNLILGKEVLHLCLSVPICNGDSCLGYGCWDGFEEEQKFIKYLAGDLIRQLLIQFYNEELVGSVFYIFGFVEKANSLSA